jgi:hypothetical protein
MELSVEELDFFKHVFANDVIECNLSEQNHKLTVHTSIPKNLIKMFGDAKLSLLAEISHYQLWFPLTLAFSETGQFQPKLGIPEILDIQGGERSWRVNHLNNVSLFDKKNEQKLKILSLSSSGLTFKICSPIKENSLLNQSDFELILPDKKQVNLALKTVRSDHNMLAAKFVNIDDGSEALRKFIFNFHRKEYSNLYKDLSL